MALNHRFLKTPDLSNSSSSLSNNIAIYQIIGKRWRKFLFLPEYRQFLKPQLTDKTLYKERYKNQWEELWMVMLLGQSFKC